MSCVLNVTLMILFFVLTTDSYSHLTHNPSREEHLLFTVLLGCLTAAGVNSINIYQRNSGTCYNELNWQWNTWNGYLEPLAYLVATDVSDVRKAVVCCRLSKVRIVVRGGGHSFVKNGFGDSRSLIVELSKLSTISLAPAQMSCDIGAGARLGRIAYKLWKNGNFLIPSGTCPTVGISGLTLGGGFGRFTTLFGLASDNLIEMEMVDANGKLLIINNSTNSDLFWALRGGGGGNFGIVTKFKFKMYSVPVSVVYLLYEYRFVDFERFYHTWQSLMTSGIPGHIVPHFELKNNSVKMEIFAFNVQHLDETVCTVTRFINLFSFPIVINPLVARVMSYKEFIVADGRKYASTSITHMLQLENIRKDDEVGWRKVKSIFIDKILDENQISKLKELLSDYLQHTELHAEPGGGAINSFSRSDTAFIHRKSNLFQIQLKVFTAQHKRPNLQADRAMNVFYEKSKSILHHHESYQNYLDADMDDYLTRYYGTNLNRLIEIKSRIDPENVFHHPQSIPVKVDEIRVKNKRPK